MGTWRPLGKGSNLKNLEALQQEVPEPNASLNCKHELQRFHKPGQAKPEASSHFLGTVKL